MMSYKKDNLQNIEHPPQEPGTDRRVLAVSQQGAIALCPGCDQFSLRFGSLEIGLSPRRLLELSRLVKKQQQLTLDEETRIRLASGIALTLSSVELSELNRLLRRCCNQATALLPLASADERWVH